MRLVKKKKSVDKAKKHLRQSKYRKTNECIVLTFTFQALSIKAPQQAATVVTECGALVVIVLEAMRHINFEALLLELQTHRDSLNPA